MYTNRIVDIERIESNVIEPISLDEMKAHLILSSTTDDDLITSLIKQCRQIIEEYCSISIVFKTCTLIADLYKEWELPYGPVIGIQSVALRTGTEGSGPATYENQSSGWMQDGSKFLTFTPIITGGFNTGSPFTGFSQSYCNRWKIGYTAGYTQVPEGLKLAIMNEIAYRYENRGEATNIRASEFTQQGVCEPARILADPYKRMLWM